MKKVISAIKKKIKIVICFFSSILYVIKKPFYKRKRILLYCTDLQLESHLIDYLESVRGIENYKIYIFYTSTFKNVENLKSAYNITIINKKSEMLFKYFHLVVTPNSFLPLMRFGRPKILYVNHCFHIQGQKNGEILALYRRTLLPYKPDIICEPNKRIAEIMKKTYPELKNAIRWSGWKFSEKQIVAEQNRQDIRERFGFKKQDKVLFVVSSWEYSCLVYRYGDAIFDELKSLSKEYKIVISFHPIVLREEKRLEVEKNLNELSKIGCIIRDPNISWIDYMAASDVVFSDYSTLTEAAIYMRKKLVFSDYSIDELYKESVIAKVKNYFPIVKDIKELKVKIEYALNNEFPTEALKYADETAISRKDYENKITEFTEELVGLKRKK